MKPIVIAHRGASGYLPEHTLAAKVLAYAMGADFLEQDIVASRDDELIVLHDIHIDRVSNIADVFPGRAREDGRYYVRDFDLDELLTLNIWERFDAGNRPVFPGRYPARTGQFRLHTLRTELELVQRLNVSGDGAIGIYPEIKRPAWHRAEGVDLSPRVLELLSEFGYSGPHDRVYLQCFDAAEVVRLCQKLGCRLPLIQLIGDNSWGESETDYDYLRTADGLAKLAEVANGIGPWIDQCYRLRNGQAKSSGLVEAAHLAGLLVHPYTVRRDSLPKGFTSEASLVDFLVHELGVDGLFTDFADSVGRRISRGPDSTLHGP